MYNIVQSLRTKSILFYDKRPATSWSDIDIIFAAIRMENVIKIFYFLTFKVIHEKKRQK